MKNFTIFFSFVIGCLLHIKAEFSEKISAATNVHVNRQINSSMDAEKHLTVPQEPQSLHGRSHLIIKSKWVSLAGCGYWSFTSTDTLTKTENKFKKLFHGNFSRAANHFNCSLRCSEQLDISHFVFYKTICMCMSNESHLFIQNQHEGNQNCWKMCNTTEQYCTAAQGVPIFVFENSVTVDTTIPAKLMTYLHQCLNEEDGVYKSREKGHCLTRLSKEDCSNLNAVFSLGVPPSTMFVQWICEKKNDTYTKYFRTIYRSSGYASSRYTEQNSTAASTQVYSEFHFEKGNLSDRQDGFIVPSIAIDTDNKDILIVNGVLLVAVIMIMAAYGIVHIIHSRKRTLSERQEIGPLNIQDKSHISSHYDTIGVEPGSDRGCRNVQITNQVYSGTDDISQ